MEQHCLHRSLTASRDRRAYLFDSFNDARSAVRCAAAIAPAADRASTVSSSAAAATSSAGTLSRMTLVRRSAYAQAMGSR